MSKSLGNLIMVEDLLKNVHPDALRLYLGNHCYREAWSFDEDELKQSADLAKKFREAVMANSGSGVPLNSESAWSSFTENMDSDLETSGAIQVMKNLADEILEAALANRDVKDAQTTLRTFCSVFGLRLDHKDADRRVVEGWNDHLKDFIKATPR